MSNGKQAVATLGERDDVALHGLSARLHRSFAKERSFEDSIDARRVSRSVQRVRQRLPHDVLLYRFDAAYVCLHLDTPYYAWIQGQKTAREFVVRG